MRGGVARQRETAHSIAYLVIGNVELLHHLGGWRINGME
jgi:hypothetical protein